MDQHRLAHAGACHWRLPGKQRDGAAGLGLLQFLGKVHPASGQRVSRTWPVKPTSSVFSALVPSVKVPFRLLMLWAACPARVGLAFFSPGNSMASAACRADRVRQLDVRSSRLHQRTARRAERLGPAADPPEMLEGSSRTWRVPGGAGAGGSRSGRAGESAMASKCSIATSQLLPHCSTTSCGPEGGVGVGVEGRSEVGRDVRGCGVRGEGKPHGRNPRATGSTSPPSPGQWLSTARRTSRKGPRQRAAPPWWQSLQRRAAGRREVSGSGGQGSSTFCREPRRAVRALPHSSRARSAGAERSRPSCRASPERASWRCLGVRAAPGPPPPSPPRAGATASRAGGGRGRTPRHLNNARPFELGRRR